MYDKVQQAHVFIRRHVSTIAFVSGFILDSLTLKRIDLVYENVVFVSYLCVAFIGILLVHAVETQRWTPALLLRARDWLPAIVQFPLGGLFSGFVIFYTKSASFVTSWPFLALLFTLFVGNEFLRRRYERLIFQIAVFYFALLSYLVLITPIILGTVRTETFMFAGVTSLFIVAVLTRILKVLFTELYTRSVRAIWFVVWGILIGYNVLYFTNTIPPVPLALREIGVYHHVERKGNEYAVRYEAPPRFMFWRDTAPVFQYGPNDEYVYCFSAVFAPAAITDDLYFSWQQKNDAGKWIRLPRVPYRIEGGRYGGYRSYSWKSNPSEGEWKCVIETEKGLVVGETQFTVVKTENAPNLVSGNR